MNPGPLKWAGADASLRGGGQLILVWVARLSSLGAVLGALVEASPGALPFPGASVVLAAAELISFGAAHTLR